MPLNPNHKKPHPLKKIQNWIFLSFKLYCFLRFGFSAMSLITSMYGIVERVYFKIPFKKLVSLLLKECLCLKWKGVSEMTRR